MPAKDLFKDKDKKFRLLFEDHPQAMWVMDPDTGHFLEANAAASRLYGYTPDEFREKRLSDLDAGSEPAAVLAVDDPSALWSGVIAIAAAA